MKKQCLLLKKDMVLKKEVGLYMMNLLIELNLWKIVEEVFIV